MEWESVLKIVAAAITSVGGAGAIIVAVTKYASNHLSEKMLKKYDAKLNKELEQYKHELRLEADKFHQMSENITYVTRMQFETEFTAYKQIFEYLHSFTVCTGMLYPADDPLISDLNQMHANYESRFNDYAKAIDSFSDVLEKNAPFIPEKHYEMFADLRTRAESIGSMFDKIMMKRNYAANQFQMEMTEKKNAETNEFNEKAAEAKRIIRDYLATLKVEKE